MAAVMLSKLLTRDDMAEHRCTVLNGMFADLSRPCSGPDRCSCAVVLMITRAEALDSDTLSHLPTFVCMLLLQCIIFLLIYRVVHTLTHIMLMKDEAS
jgi:hypothetical protein